MYPNYNPNVPYNLYGMPNYQPNNQAQPIQKIEQKTPQASCYFVSSADSFKVDALPGIYCLGINEKDDEIYIRKVNELGNPELKTYKLAEEKKEKSELQQINEKLSNIEKQLEVRNGTNTGSETSHN